MLRMIDELYTYIMREASKRASLIVAIDGRCASGKTTLASELVHRMDANLLHMDDFFLRPEQRTLERLAIPGENIDHERFLNEVLLPLKAGNPFSYRPFSCRSQALCESVTVEPKPVTIVEGSYACHPSLRAHYDLRLFLTVEPTEQMRRIERRNGAYAAVFKEQWIPLEEAYFSLCRVRECCDRVIDSSTVIYEEKSKKF